MKSLTKISRKVKPKDFVGKKPRLANNHANFYFNNRSNICQNCIEKEKNIKLGEQFNELFQRLEFVFEKYSHLNLREEVEAFKLERERYA